MWGSLLQGAAPLPAGVSVLFPLPPGSAQPMGEAGAARVQVHTSSTGAAGSESLCRAGWDPFPSTSIPSTSIPSIRGCCAAAKGWH